MTVALNQQHDADCLVVGGGPAGCAAATLLARWGHSVTLVTKAASEPPLGESLPPSTRKLLDLLGALPRMDAAGFVRATGNTVWWGSAPARAEYFAHGERGWQVTTTAMESIGRELAADAGARIERTRFDAADERARAAAFVLDCSGRAGIYARVRGLRVPDTALRTIAMVGLWSARQFELPDPTHTLIQSYDGGWAWSVPHSAASGETRGAQRFVAVMVDPRTSDLTRRSASRAVYLAEIRKAGAIGRLLAEATLVDGPRGWDASMYQASRYVDGNVLLVGDAGSFIDPLSSAGVKKALASGWLAAVAVHTSLIRPSARGMALDFFNQREHEVYAGFRALTESYWRDAAAGHAHPFWADRAGDDHPATEQAAVSRAFERIRGAPELRLSGNPAVAIEDRPAVSGSEIVLERRLVRSGHSVRYVHDVDLLALVQLAPAHTSVPALFEAYNSRHAPVALPHFLAALATAVAQQWLLWCDTN